MQFKWQRTENGLFTILGEETVILNLATNDYYSLNEVSTFIWEKLERTLTKVEVIEHVMNEYEVSKDQCEKDITLLFSELLSIDLIERVE